MDLRVYQVQSTFTGIDDDEPLRHTHLRRRQAHPIGRVHSALHIFEEFSHPPCDLRDGLRDLAKPGVVCEPDTHNGQLPDVLL